MRTPYQNLTERQAKVERLMGCLWKKFYGKSKMEDDFHKCPPLKYDISGEGIVHACVKTQGRRVPAPPPIQTACIHDLNYEYGLFLCVFAIHDSIYCSHAAKIASKMPNSVGVCVSKLYNGL